MLYDQKGWVWIPVLLCDLGQMASSLWQVLWQRNKHPTTQWLNATATYLAHGFGGQQFRLGPAKQSFGSGQGSADLGWAHSCVCCHLLGPLGLAAQLALFGMNGTPGLISMWSLSLHHASLGIFTAPNLVL